VDRDAGALDPDDDALTDVEDAFELVEGALTLSVANTGRAKALPKKMDVRFMGGL
jgi:hypothetical protein